MILALLCSMRIQHTVHKVPAKSEFGTADILSPTCRHNGGIPPIKDHGFFIHVSSLWFQPI